MRKENCAFTKAASIPTLRQSENAGPRLFGFIFDAVPHLEYFSNFFELSTKAAFAKAAFDTLRVASAIKTGKADYHCRNSLRYPSLR